MLDIIYVILQLIIALELCALLVENKPKQEVKEKQSRRIVSDAYGYRDPLTGYRTNSRGQYIVRKPNEEYGVEEDEI